MRYIYPFNGRTKQMGILPPILPIPADDESKLILATLFIINYDWLFADS